MVSPVLGLGAVLGSQPINNDNTPPPKADQSQDSGSQPPAASGDTTAPAPAASSDTGNQTNGNSTGQSAAQPATPATTVAQPSEKVADAPEKAPVQATAQSVVESQTLTEDQELMIARRAAAAVQEQMMDEAVIDRISNPPEAIDITGDQAANDNRDSARAKEAFAETREIARQQEESAAKTLRERL